MNKMMSGKIYELEIDKGNILISVKLLFYVSNN